MKKVKVPQEAADEYVLIHKREAGVSFTPPRLNVSLGKGLKMVVLGIIASVRVIGKMSALINPGQMLGRLSLVLWLHDWVFLGLRCSPKLWIVRQIIQHSFLKAWCPFQGLIERFP